MTRRQQNRPEPGFHGSPVYLQERLSGLDVRASPMRPDMPLLRLQREDLPKIAELFQLGVEVRGKRIHWICFICGDLGSELLCDAEKHAAFYDDWEGQLEPTSGWTPEEWGDVLPLDDDELAQRRQRLGQG